MTLERSTAALDSVSCHNSLTFGQALKDRLFYEHNAVNSDDSVRSDQSISEEQPAGIPFADSFDLNERTTCVPTPRHKPPLRFESTSDHNCGAPKSAKMQRNVEREAATSSWNAQSDRTLVSQEAQSQHLVPNPRFPRYLYVNLII